MSKHCKIFIFMVVFIHFPALALAMQSFTTDLSLDNPTTNIYPQSHDQSSSIPWGQLGARVAEQNPAMAGSVEPVQGGALLTSPVQRLEGTVTLQGLRIESTAEGREGGFTLQAVRLGRDDVMTAVSDGLNVEIDSSLARLIRTDVTEEFSTSADGIRQDFLLHASPPGKGQVRLELALSGATVEPSPYGARIILAESSRALAYHRLLVLDALDRELPARMDAASPTLLALVVDDTDAAYPIRIDPTFTDENWVSMGTSDDGMNGTVRALAIHGDTVYVGGDFTEAGGKPAAYIAQWDGSKWSPVGSGMNGAVHALVAVDGILYAGGDFTVAGGNTANRVARWDGSEWSALGTGGNNGVNGTVRALAVSGTTVFVGGDFTQAGEAAHTQHIAKWNGTDWSALGSGTNENGFVYALAVDKFGNLYAGGSFTSASGVANTSNIAKWDGTWSALGTGMNGRVSAISVSDVTVYAGGIFTTAGGVTVNHIAKWNDSLWQRMGPADYPGMDAAVNDLVLDSGGNVYAGGSFTTAGGMDAEKVAKWNPTAGDDGAWITLGNGVNNFVEALAVDTEGNVYAGGSLTFADNAPAKNIAKYNSELEAWSPVASGLNGPVTALAFSGSDIYVGGEFGHVAGIPVYGIAKWDGVQWNALVSGVFGIVYALAADSDGNLYAGGLFTSVDGVEDTENIAKWDGVQWDALDSGMSGTVRALAVDSDNNLYAGGLFTSAGGEAAENIAKWDGAWSALGSGIDEPVSALAVDSFDNLYVGGSFNHGVAKWDGTSWSALGSGVNNYVMRLTISGDKLYVGGMFTTAGDKDSHYLAYANLPTSTTHTVTPSAGTGGNVSPSTPQTVNEGQTATFTVTPDSGYTRNAAVGGTCPQGSWSGDDWTTGAITADCTVSFSFTPSADPGTLKWSFRVNEADGDPYVRSSPALSADGEVVYFGANDGKVYAVNTVDGTPLDGWHSSTDGPVRSSPAVDSSGVYVGSNDGKMHKLNYETGSPVSPWPFTTTSGSYIWSSPAIGPDGAVYFGSNDGWLYARQASESGKWDGESRVNLGSEVMSSPAVHGNYVYVGTYGGELHARHVDTGASKTGFPFQASWIIYSSPAIGAEGTIYFATTDGKVYALNPNGTQKWVRSLGETFVFSSPVLGWYNLYIGCNNGMLYALKKTDGSDAWSLGFDPPSPIMSTPAVAAKDSSNEIVYFGSYNGGLFAVNGNDGSMRWSFHTSGPIYASPTVDADGTVYVGSHDGFMYAIAGEADYIIQDYYSWPKFRKDVWNTGVVPE